MSVFEDILARLDLGKEVYKVLGLPDPEKYPDPALGETHKREDIPLIDWISPYATDIWTWIKDNRVLVALFLISVFFGVLWLRKR